MVTSADLSQSPKDYIGKSVTMEGIIKLSSRGKKDVWYVLFDDTGSAVVRSSEDIPSDKVRVFAEIKETTGLPVLTDVHSPENCAAVADVIDVLQIPAFLCRQTDLLLAAAATGRAINVKKGQFLAPWDMANVAVKITEAGNDNVMLCERGVSFGYNTLVSDMRSLPIMAQTGHPIVFDATHSVQQPGGQGVTSGGQREFVPILARAAISIGVAAVFMEVHQDPDNAPSDGPNMVYLDKLPGILEQLLEFDRLAKANPVSI